MNKQPKWSLHGEIRQRKTDELRRTIEARQVLHPSIQRTVQTKPLTSAPRPHNAPAKRMEIIPARPYPTAHVSVGHWTKHLKQTIAGTVMLVLVSCLLTSLLVIRSPLPPLALAALPTTTANSAVNYLKTLGLPVTRVKALSVPNENWTATEEIQFNLGQANTAGVFVVLSYDSPAQAGVDGFRATYHSKFKQWNLIQISNMLLLSSPSTALPLSDSVASHLTHYLISPYRSYMPTATADK